MYLYVSERDITWCMWIHAESLCAHMCKYCMKDTNCVCLRCCAYDCQCLVTSAALLAGCGSQQAAGASNQGDESRGHNLDQWDKAHKYKCTHASVNNIHKLYAQDTHRKHMSHTHSM